MESLLNRYKSKLPQIGLATALGFVIFMQIVAGMFFAAQQTQQSDAIRWLYGFAFSMILTLWVQYDSRLSGISMGYDQAFYMFFGWPILFPIYAFRSRGFRRGGLLLLLLFGVIVFAVIAALIIGVAISMGIAVASSVG
jgi:hypothetical protein